MNSELPNTKTCAKCREVRSRDEFHNDRNTKDGKRGSCKACVAEQNAAWYQRTGKDRAKANQRRRIATDPDFRAARRDRMLRAKFGLTLADFRELLAAQGDACAICGITNAVWHIDHDHTTGEIRGVLCPNCNRALGYFADNPDRLRQAAEYLDANAPREARAL